MYFKFQIKIKEEVKHGTTFITALTDIHREDYNICQNLTNEEALLFLFKNIHDLDYVEIYNDKGLYYSGNGYDVKKDHEQEYNSIINKS